MLDLWGDIYFITSPVCDVCKNAYSRVWCDVVYLSSRNCRNWISPHLVLGFGPITKDYYSTVKQEKAVLIPCSFWAWFPLGKDLCTGISPQSRTFFLASSLPTVGQKIKKKSRPKKLVKSNKSISRKKFFDQIPFFAIPKVGKNQFLNWAKV